MLLVASPPGKVIVQSPFASVITIVTIPFTSVISTLTFGIPCSPASCTPLPFTSSYTVPFNVPSLSVIVTVPESLKLLVLPLVTVPVTINSSVGSPTASSTIPTATLTVVDPAGIVTLTTVVV